VEPALPVKSEISVIKVLGNLEVLKGIFFLFNLFNSSQINNEVDYLKRQIQEFLLK